MMSKSTHSFKAWFSIATVIAMTGQQVLFIMPSLAQTTHTGSTLHTVSAPQTLKWNELIELAQKPKVSGNLEHKVQALLNTPFIYNNSTARLPRPVYHETTGPALRAASWNIERGFHLENVIRAFMPKEELDAFNEREEEIHPYYDMDLSDRNQLQNQYSDWDKPQFEMKNMPLDTSSPQRLTAGVQQKVKYKNPESNPRMRAKAAKFQEERDWLSHSEVLLLTEVDNGMKRTNYQDITKQLAEHLGMNAVYGVEFLELAPLSKRRLEYAAKHKHKIHVAGEDNNVNSNQYLGMHGSAILTRYPILKTEIIRLPDCYDWYKKEQARISQLEKVKRSLSEKIFLETMLTEVRKGGRMAMAVDLEIPELPEKRATFVVAHLENRCEAPCRRKQLMFLLNKMKDRQNPVVFGGDFNTSGSDVSPTSVTKEVRVRLKDPAFWARSAIGTFVPFGYAVNAGLLTTNFLKHYHNPATPSIPILFPNPEYGFFRKLRGFRFADGTRIDLRGKDEMAYNGRGGFMANSNQRELKGFVPTFEFERLFMGVLGRYKLDWFLVKAYLKPDVLKQEKEMLKEAKIEAKKEEKLQEAVVQKQKEAEKLAATKNIQTEKQSVSDAIPANNEMDNILLESVAESPKREMANASDVGIADDDGNASDAEQTADTEENNAPVTSRLFAPHFARTLVQVSRYRDDERLSDHTPITIDLPLTVPPVNTK